MSTIEEMHQNMTEAGFYTKADIDKICDLEQQYRDECQEIASQCKAEGYPANGSNYELRCAEVRKYYDHEFQLIDANYDFDEE